MSALSHVDIARAKVAQQLGKRLDAPARLDPTKKPKTDLKVAVAAVGEDALKQAELNKRTGEWKVTSTAPRKSDFGGKYLHDHHGTHLGRRKQESNWFITINPNQKQATHLKQDSDAIVQALHETFETRGYDILTFGPKHPDVYGDDAQWPHLVVDEMNARATIERGPNTGALHCHLYFKVVHWSQVYLNQRQVQLIFKDAYNQLAFHKIPGNKKPYVQYKLLEQTDFGEIIAHYLSKQLPGTAAQPA